MQHVDPGGLIGREPIHADNNPFAAVDFLLRPVGRLLDLALDQALFDGLERAAGGVDSIDDRARLVLDASGHLLDRVGAAAGVDGIGDAGLGCNHLLGSKCQPRGFLGGQRQRFITPVAMQRLRAAEHGRQRLKCHADDVVVGLLGGQRAAGSLRVEAQLLGAGVRRAEAVAHEVRPQPARGSKLGDLLEKIVMCVEEERQALAEPVDVETGIDRRLNVRNRMRECERDLLDRCRAGFTDVVAADRNRVPVGELVVAERKNVGDDPERGARGKDVRAARDVFLEDVVLHGARDRRERHALAFRDGGIQRQQHDRRRIDGHRRRHAIERDPVEQLRHVLDRVDGDADPADLARGELVIGVVPDLRWQIEGHAQAVDPLCQQVPVALIGFRR